MNVFRRVHVPRINVSRFNAAAAATLAIGLAVAAVPAWPDAFPSRPIHLIVNFAPGGTGDIVARLVGAKLSTAVGQSVVVENRPGAGGMLGARDVVNAEPDGYTLTVAQTPEIAINPFFMKDAGYDPRKDLQPIALAGVAAPDIPTVAEATGIPNFDFTLWVGFFGPRALPMDVTQRLNAEINKILLDPDIKFRLQNDGAAVSALSIDEFAAFVGREIEKYQAIIRAADLKPE